ncbi:MAG: hypothetical protein AAF600_01660 [Bacteroidota bacterium]
MKQIMIYAMVILFVSCGEQESLTPSETSKKVAQSFFNKDEYALKKHTTEEGYASLVTVQNMMQTSDKDITVEILDEVIKGETAWVKYTTSFDNRPGIFKLVQVDGQWKVTSKGARERGPF